MPRSPSPSAAYDPLGEHLADPYPFYRQADPVFYAPLVRAWVVTRYDDVMQVLKDPTTFSSANALPRVLPIQPAALRELHAGYPQRPSALDADGELHRRLRAPLAAVLAPDRVALLEPFIRERAEGLVDELADAAHADLMAQYARRLPVMVLGELCALGETEAQTVRDGVDGLTVMTGTPLPEAEQAAAARRFVALQQLVGRLVRDRRGRGEGAARDAIGEIVAMMVPGDAPLDVDQEATVVNNVLQLLVAGTITTIPLLGNALWLLLAGGDRWARLLDSPESLPRAVEELCRLGASATGLYRVTTRRATLGGVTLAPGTPLVLRFGAANRDPAWFDRPDELDLSRHPNRHLTFGFGAHYCVGASLAKAQLLHTLRAFAARLPGLRLAGTVEVRPVLDLRGPVALPVAWERSDQPGGS